MSIILVGPINSGVGAGGAGVATSNDTSDIVLDGIVMGVYVKYNDAPPAGTTDVTVATLGTSPHAPAQTILSLENAATDAWFYPTEQIDTTAGAAIANEYRRFAIYDKVKVTIAQANNGDSVDVWILLDQ